MPIATIIGAIVAAGAGITGGILQNRATEKTNKENFELSEIARSDTLSQQAVQNQQQQQSFGLQQQQLGLNSRQHTFAEKESALNRKERNEERGYNRLQHAADRFSEYLNNKQVLTKNRLSPLMRSK